MLTNNEKIEIIEHNQCDSTSGYDEFCEMCGKPFPLHSVMYCFCSSGDGWTECSYWCEECAFIDWSEEQYGSGSCVNRRE